MPRTYTKKSGYWNQPRKPAVVTQPTPDPVASVSTAIAQAGPIDFTPTFDGQTHFTSVAACGGGNVNEVSVRSLQSDPAILDTVQYPNIRSGIVPLDTVEGNYSVSNAVGLVYQAYFNFAILRNAINLLADFSISKIHVKTKNQKLKTFINTWFDAIGLNQFMAKFFLEYYRSGNVFMYKFSGRISEDGFNMLRESYAAKGISMAKTSPVIPIRYIILNPMQVYLQRGASYTYGYVRMLSTYEIERLKNPQTDEDKQMFRSFPPDIQRQIQQGGAWRYLFVPLDQNRLYYCFYRKQDYEPLAVPMAYPVLNDIEFKLNLRRIDTALANTMEQVFMLVTAGRAADQFNLVSGPKVLQNLQDIFSNKAIGRVLVADYTTKAEWKIPDLKDLLGPDKYERVDQDIKEGLQYMFFGDEKFANASVKMKIFVNSLNEGRRTFIEQFLLPEVKKICEVMNFKNIPELEFEKIQIQDEALMNRLYVQLAQLGLLDPTETFNAMTTGLLPNQEESLVHQDEYKKARSKGLYQPLAPAVGGPGGGAPGGAPNGRPPGTTGTPAPRKVATPIGQKKVGRGVASQYHFGAAAIADNLMQLDTLRGEVQAALIKKWKLKELNEAQASVATSITKSIAFNEGKEAWKGSVKAYVKAPKEIPQQLQADLANISTEFEVDGWQATALLLSRVPEPASEAGEGV